MENFSSVSKEDQQLSLNLIDAAREAPAQRVPSDEIATFYNDNLHDLDWNGNGVVTDKELKAYEAAHGSNSNLKYLEDHFKEIESMSFEGWLQLGQGITDRDMEQFEALKDPDYQHHVTTLDNVSLEYKRLLPRLDLDRNGGLSKSELEQASRNMSLDTGARYMVEFLRRNFDDLATEDKYEHLYITPPAVNDLRKTYESGPPTLKMAVDDLLGTGRVGLGGALLGLFLARPFENPETYWNVLGATTGIVAVVGGYAMTRGILSQRESNRVDFWRTMHNLDAEMIKPASQHDSAAQQDSAP